LNRYRLEVRIIPRPGLLDPEGKAIHHSLDSLGYEGVARVRVGKAVMLDLDAASSASAVASAEEMCRRLLANPVTEEYSIEVLEEVPEGAR
jgi:phosphoribosylformylglycinamidine synthase